MKLLMCQCIQCRHGRKGYRERYRIKHMRSAARSKSRRMLRKGEYEKLPNSVLVGYTD